MEVQKQYHRAVVSEDTPDAIRHRTPDDAIRFLSFFFAASNATDKVTLLARQMVEDLWTQQRVSIRARKTRSAGHTCLYNFRSMVGWPAWH